MNQDLGLEDHLIGEVPPMESDGGELLPLDIESREYATKMLRLYRQTERASEKIKAEAEAEMAPIREWRDDRLSGVKRRMEWLTTGLRQWMLAERSRTGVKSISLPTGTIKSRAPQKRVEVVGELTAEHAVKYPPVMERNEYTIDKASAARLFTQGERIGFDGNDALYEATYQGEVVSDVIFRVPLDPTFSIVPLNTEGQTDDE